MADPQGISIAFDDVTLAPTPTWTRIDDGVTKVASYTIDRGRQYELDRTDGGRATVAISDTNGVLDPTNAAGAYYGKIEPLLQTAIARYNPVTHTWQTRFRGFISDYDYDYDRSQRVNRLVLSLTDIFEILNACEMLPGFFGDTPPTGAEGQIFFDNARCDDRINQVLGNAFGTTAAAAFSVVFTGNVSVQETTYSPGESAMSVVQDAADAEFPGVSNVYTDRFGRIVFHGRLAKFDPATTAASAGTANWDFQHWHVADTIGVASAGSTATAIVSEFSFNRGLSKVINFAQATPMGVSDAALASGTMVIQDTASISTYGYRSWSRDNLITDVGLLDSSSATVECRKFAQYYIDNYASPRNRVTTLGFRPVMPTSSLGTIQWKFLTQVDIADQVDITMRGASGSTATFNQEPYFVEGIHEVVNSRIPNSAGSYYDEVTVNLDVSPQAYFTTNPFPTS